jgi:YVTN family beta-propeller protein
VRIRVWEIVDDETKSGQVAGSVARVLGRTGMKRWIFYSVLILALGIGAVGCGGGGTPTTITISISPATTSVITNTPQTFTAFVSGSSDQTATWAVSCPTGVTACGTIDTSSGASNSVIYTAPITVPTVTTNGTTTVTPTATITATAHADTTKKATATVTIISGISISITPTTATVGTNEHFQFVATVVNPGCVNTAGTTDCLNVTWSVPTTGTVGSITVPDPTTPNVAKYIAPGSATTVTVTATSVKDTAVTATATVTVVTAAPPTVTSVSPTTVALGSLFQDIYITGTNFISTNSVSVNGITIGGNIGPDSFPLVSVISSSVIRARIPDTSLVMAGFLTVAVSQQTGTPQTCSPPSQCQILVTGVRPAIIGPSPDNIQQSPPSAGSSLSFNINGGFFGTSGNISVNATYDGKPHTVQVANARQMSVIIGGSNSADFSVPGLHPVAVISNADATKLAVTNIAVQPNYANGGSTISAKTSVMLPAGSSPSDVAINDATGLAVVANTKTHSVSFIDLTAASPVLGATICTGATGAASPPCATPSGPTSIAVNYINNSAVVVNSTAQTIAMVDLNTKSVTSVTPLFQTPPSDAAQHPPVAVGINPCANLVTSASTCQARALVTIQNRPYGLLLDVTQTPPVVLGPVTITTGANSRVAVEPHLNWAISTPGGIGSIGIVDLNRQTQNSITNMSRASNVVTVTVQASTTAAPQPPLAVHLNDTVFIQGVSDPSFDGFYSVTGLGPQSGQFSYTQSTSGPLSDKTPFNTPGTVNYAAPVATLGLTTTVQGISINPETQQSVLVDPSPNGASAGVVSFFSLLDQTPSSVTLRGPNTPSGAPGPVEIGSIAGAFNPLTNVAVTVNPSNNTLSVIDPSAPARLTSSSLSGTDPVAVAVDPALNLAVIANQSSDSVSIVSLGDTIRPLSIVETSPKQFVVNSTLLNVASPGVANLTIIGKGFSSSSVARLDEIGLVTTFVSDRELTAIVPPALLGSARRFALDVLNADGTVSNASDFTVTQSIDVSTACSAPPQPSGVAIDPVKNFAIVSLAGCGSAAVIDLSTGLGPAVRVGTNPIGVAVVPRLGKAVVANTQSNNASIVDELAGSATNVTTGSNPIGVAADQDTGEAAVANSSSNTVSVVNLASNGVTSITTGQHPVAVAFDYLTRQVAAAADASNSVGIATAPSGSQTATFGLNGPSALAYDPATNTFLAASSSNNSVTIYDPTTQQQLSFLRVGINPTAMAFNYLTGTLITTNTGSHTITVADILSNRIRAVLTLPAPPVNSSVGAFQFAVDIHPLTNLAVIADTANGRVLLVPVPR